MCRKFIKILEKIKPKASKIEVNVIIRNKSMYSRWLNGYDGYVIFFHMSLFIHAHFLHTIFSVCLTVLLQRSINHTMRYSIELQPTEIRHPLRCNRLKVASLSTNFDFAEKKASNPPLFFLLDEEPIITTCWYHLRSTLLF